MLSEEDFAGLPWGMKHMIMNTLRNEKCTPDHVLMMAEAMDECVVQLGPKSIYLAACQRTANRLRESAPSFAKPGFYQGDINAADNE